MKIKEKGFLSILLFAASYAAIIFSKELMLPLECVHDEVKGCVQGEIVKETKEDNHKLSLDARIITLSRQQGT